MPCFARVIFRFQIHKLQRKRGWPGALRLGLGGSAGCFHGGGPGDASAGGTEPWLLRGGRTDFARQGAGHVLGLVGLIGWVARVGRVGESSE